MDLIFNEIDISSLLNAHATLGEALEEADSRLERDGTLLRFEYTYELAWKTLKRLLAHQGKTCNSPREVFREAAAEGWVADPVVWFEIMRKRNLTTHSYNLEVADEIFAALPEIHSEVAKLIDVIKAL